MSASAPTRKDHTSVRPWRAIQRRPSRKIRVGSVEVGGDAPITVQSMTTTLTADAAATIALNRQLEEKSEERRVGTKCASTCSSRGSRYNKQKKKNKQKRY